MALFCFPRLHICPLHHERLDCPSPSHHASLCWPRMPAPTPSSPPKRREGPPSFCWGSQGTGRGADPVYPASPKRPDQGPGREGTRIHMAPGKHMQTCCCFFSSEHTVVQVAGKEKQLQKQGSCKVARQREPSQSPSLLFQAGRYPLGTGDIMLAVTHVTATLVF